MKSAEYRYTTESWAKWPLVFAAVIFGVLGAQTASKIWMTDYWEEWTRIGFGAMAAAITVFLSAYRIRKAFFSRMMGSMATWRQSHLYLGLLTALLIMSHTNFRVHGEFGIMMIIIFCFVVISGIVGEIIYRTIPVWLSKQGIDALELDSQRREAEEVLTLADEIVEGSSPEFKEYYGKKIRKYFARNYLPSYYLFNTEKEVIQRRQILFESLTKGVPHGDKTYLRNLEILYMERDKMDYRWSRLRILRWWHIIHVPANVALLAAVFLHILSIAYF